MDIPVAYILVFVIRIGQQDRDLPATDFCLGLFVDLRLCEQAALITSPKRVQLSKKWQIYRLIC